jgi:hypothetical protein
LHGKCLRRSGKIPNQDSQEEDPTYRGGLRCHSRTEKFFCSKGHRRPLGDSGNSQIENRRKTKNKAKVGLRLRSYIKKVGLNVEVKGPVGTFQQTYSHFKLTLYLLLPVSDAKKREMGPAKNLSLFPMSRIHRRIAEKQHAENRR